MRRGIITLLVVSLAALALGGVRAEPEGNGGKPVTLREDEGAFTLSNGLVTARVDKRTGNFTLRQGDLELINRGYWSQVGRGPGGSIANVGAQRTAAVRIDPAGNSGERAEVSVRFGYDGKSPGLPCDVDLRFALGRGDHGLYTYGIWDHQAAYPAFSVGEARTAYKLNPAVFDYLAVDEKRRGVLPSGADWDQGEQLNMKEVRRIRTGPLAGRVEHKYDYSAILPDTPAYGWCSTSRHVGVWLINPSFEYVAGGPTKVELTGHLDVNPGGAPTLLNMWHGSHYGGSSLAVADREAWSKVIGPFMLYCNAAPSPDEMWRDALRQAKAEQAKWPYAWISEPKYPLAAARGTVAGRLTIKDPGTSKLDARNLRIGLAAPGADWQRDSKYYEFWTRAMDDGRFTIPNVRPGAYTLYAFADGVLGEFSKVDVTVTAGQHLDLGPLTWTPVRHGRQVWEIGVPDRSAGEFRHGDDYWHWGLYYRYPQEFPDDVHFTIGKSNPRTDWNYVQPPRIEGNRATPTTWSISFDLPEAPKGKATLRLAIAGSRNPRGVDVIVNGQPAGGTGPLPDTGVMHRDGIRGYWCERDVTFDAALLKAGTNVVKLTAPANNWVQGVLYDYLRLELAP